jgi:hypothetical protein
MHAHVPVILVALEVQASGETLYIGISNVS